MSVQGLLSEIRPNLEVFQSIKAAEQLFFKDKTHYVDFQPVFISANRKDKIEGIVRHQSNKSSNNVHVDEKDKGDVNANKGKKEIKKEKISVQNIKKEKLQNSDHKEDKTCQNNFVNSCSSTSKLQQAIMQAQKTIEVARNVGSKSAKICELPNSNIDELQLLRSENAFLCKKLELHEKTINRLKKITSKLLQNSGMTEADFSD